MSGTLTLLFYHLLHHREAVASLTQELDDQLGLLDEGSNYNYQNFDSTLPYTRACVLENYGITPVFTMPLPRVVTSKSCMIQIHAFGATSSAYKAESSTIAGLSCFHSPNSSSPTNIS